MTYEEWIDYTFMKGGMGTVHPDVIELLAHCRRFFRSAPQSIVGIPSAKVALAMRTIPSVDGYLGILRRPDLPLPDRYDLAAAHFDLFRDLFADGSFAEQSFMWWKNLVGAEYGIKSYGDSPCVREDADICRELSDAIIRILSLPSEACQMSALHGLNVFRYLTGRDTAAVITKFLESGSQATVGVRQYAERVLRGDAP